LSTNAFVLSPAKIANKKLKNKGFGIENYLAKMSEGKSLRSYHAFCMSTETKHAKSTKKGCNEFTLKNFANFLLTEPKTWDKNCEKSEKLARKTAKKARNWREKLRKKRETGEKNCEKSEKLARKIEKKRETGENKTAKNTKK
jgi:hypothetical protein